MELLENVLAIVGVVLVSAVVDRLLPRVPLPLVQMVAGVALVAVLGAPVELDLGAELFLALFIAPLLFSESRHVDKRGLMGNLPSVLSLAIGLVVATMLAVGFVLHWLEPSIPLAAAFALGAALGPTDAVAVASLGPSVRLSERQEAQLSGESLINDASGVVSFQFALAAAVTGAFSLADATAAFAFSFFAGLAMGAVMGLVAMAAITAVRAIGLDSAAFHATFELALPFVAFLLAEHAGASGILAVVAAGLVVTLFPRSATVANARIDVVSSGVWDALAFVLNGIVFVYLGAQLPAALLPSWGGSDDALSLVGTALAVTAVVVAVRFAWVLAMNCWNARGGGCVAGSLVRDSLVTTLCGAKGAVTLSIILTLPYVVATGDAFPARNELIFIASVVIIVTLLLANYAVPLVAAVPKGADEGAELDVARRKVLDRVARELRIRSVADLAYIVALHSYEERLSELPERAPTEGEEAMRRLRSDLLADQRKLLSSLRSEGVVDDDVALYAGNLLDRVFAFGVRRGPIAGKAPGKMAVLRMAMASKRKHPPKDADAGRMAALLGLMLERALAYLDEQASSVDAERAQAAHVLSDALSTASAPGDRAEGPMGVAGSSRRSALGDLAQRVEAAHDEALHYELDVIVELLDEGAISESQASRLRNDTYLILLASSK